MTDISAKANPRQATSEQIASNFASMDRKLDAREAERKRRKKKKSKIPFAVLRLRDIERVTTELYGSIIPWDDDGALVHLEILIATVIAAGKPPGCFMWKLAPWMPKDAAEKFVAGVDMSLAWLKADKIAKWFRVNFAAKQRLKLRTIGAYDILKPERDAIYKARKAAKRKQRAAEKKKAKLTPRDQAIMAIVDRMNAKGIPGNMGDIQRQAARHKLFKGRQDIPRHLGHDVKKLVERNQIQTRGGLVYYAVDAGGSGERSPGEATPHSTGATA
jgi:hypothetical protein